MDDYIVLDEGTTEAILKLKKVFKVKTMAGVIRKGIALSRICSRFADKDGIVTIENKSGKLTTIDLRN